MKKLPFEDMAEYDLGKPTDLRYNHSNIHCLNVVQEDPYFTLLGVIFGRLVVAPN